MKFVAKLEPNSKWADECVVFGVDGNFDVEETAFNRQLQARPIPPNPPPLRVGKVDPKTIASRSVSDLIDCGSWKTQAVMQFYIDCANRKSGNCFPSIETTANRLDISVRSVERANAFWRRQGYLSVPRRGFKTPDGRSTSNAYHIDWLALIAVVAERHWNKKLRNEAHKVLHSTVRAAA